MVNIDGRSTCMLYLTKVVLFESALIILKRSFKSRDYIQKEQHGSYFEVSAIQALSVTLT